MELSDATEKKPATQGRKITGLMENTIEDVKMRHSGTSL
jgi:hypothetical protein